MSDSPSSPTADHADPDVRRWIDAYLRAWSSNDVDDIHALFTADAEYTTDPWKPATVGIEAITAEWLRRRDEADDFTFRWHQLARDGALTIVQGETVYRRGVTYSNLWLVALEPDGRAAAFTEWWMDQADPS